MISLATIVSILVVLHVIIGLAKRPDSHEYMATGHYYLDYFYYLTPIAQGMRGQVLSFQQFSIEDNFKYPHLWPYILIGQIARVIKLTPVMAYWLAVFAISFVLLILLYRTIKKLLGTESVLVRIGAVLMTLFAGSFFTVQYTGQNIQVTDYVFWYSIGNFFRRFEPVPHHLLGSLIVLNIFLSSSDFMLKVKNLNLIEVLKKSFWLSILFVLLLSFNSYSIIVPFSALFITIFVYMLGAFLRKEKYYLNYLIFLTIIFSLVFFSVLLLRSYYATSPFMERFKSVELNLHQDPGIKLMLLNTGPIIILFFLGLKKYFKRVSGLKVLFLTFLLVSYIFYFSPLDRIIGTHNGRFLSGINYLVLGSAGALGLSQISSFFKRKKKAMFIIFLLVFLLYSSIPTIRTFLGIINDRNIFSPITYLPKGIVNGFELLDKLPQKGNIMVTPSQFLGQVLPVFSDRKVYIARQIVTPDYIAKNITASNFYLGNMTEQEAKKLLRDNAIAYVILTSIEGYSEKSLYGYSFLKEVYKNKDILIFSAKY